jgi:hypothetical protein
MQLIAAFRGRTPVTMELSFEDFLCSGLMQRQAKAAMCSADDLVTDYLPDFDCSNPDEVREAFAEACEQASEYAVSQVRLDDDDEKFVQQHFLRARHFGLSEHWLPEAV